MGGVLDNVKSLIGDGDLAGFTQKFREKGLDEEVASWISKGQNLPIVGEQIQKVLGQDVVAGVAARLGIKKRMVHKYLRRGSGSLPTRRRRSSRRRCRTWSTGSLPTASCRRRSRRRSGSRPSPREERRAPFR